MLRNSILIFIAIAVAGCTVHVSSPTGRVKKYVEVFFKGNGQSLYFIKPVPLRSTSADAFIDFTFSRPDSAHLAYASVSILSDIASSPLDSVCISNQTITVVPADLVLLFRDHTKKKKEMRYRFSLSESAMDQLLENDDLLLIVYRQGVAQIFDAGKAWGKSRARARAVIVE